MAGRRRLLPGLLLPLLGACNMALSEAPMLTDADQSALVPKDGVWVGEDGECRFDSAKPETDWPDCATWLVIRHAGREVLLQDGKGQGEHGRYLISGSAPAIVQVEYTDEAKEDGKTFYVFFGLDPGPQGSGMLTSASTWEVKCGVEGASPSDITPFPGISPECRPSSKDAIRAAALASRASAKMAMRWRWLRPEQAR